ncbi:MAG: hypothetical protein RLZZ26_678 [Candidatus Parcubacteria bacterium]|jgi:hypothetical protein
MSFLGGLFHSTKKESLVLIEISASSVAGGYAYYVGNAKPVLVFSRRLPIEIQGDEPHEKAMLRALEELGSILIKEGAPALLRQTGSGSAGTVLVSIDAPWQATSVRTEVLERKTPFTFTKAMVTTAIEKTAVATPGKILADESIIGIILNGYETRQPYGRRVHRASIIVLTSLIDEQVSKSIVTTLRHLFHTHNILSIASSSLRYQTMRVVFPHERSALILDAMGSLLSISLMRRRLLVAVTEVAESIPVKDVDLLVQKIIDEFTELAKRYPLPRTIFLLDQGTNGNALDKTLNATKLAGLWLTDNPPTIVSVAPSNLTDFVQQAATTAPDLSLLMMALYWQHRAPA